MIDMLNRHEVQVLSGRARTEGVAELAGVSQSSVQRIEAEGPVAALTLGRFPRRDQGRGRLGEGESKEAGAVAQPANICARAREEAAMVGDLPIQLAEPISVKAQRGARRIRSSSPQLNHKAPSTVLF
jgi:hypothetical protein